jgi:hypothetical protein
VLNNLLVNILVYKHIISQKSSTGTILCITRYIPKQEGIELNMDVQKLKKYVIHSSELFYIDRLSRNRALIAKKMIDNFVSTIYVSVPHKIVQNHMRYLHIKEYNIFKDLITIILRLMIDLKKVCELSMGTFTLNTKDLKELIK